MIPVTESLVVLPPVSELVIPVNPDFLIPRAPMPDPTSHPRLSSVQIEAIELLARGRVVLDNEGQYALERNPDVVIRKPVLRALAVKGLAAFKEKGRELSYEITDEGMAAADPSSIWRRPTNAPGRAPRTKPQRAPRPPIEGRKGFTISFVQHKLAKDRAFPTVADATDMARRIQAGYVAKGKTPPDIEVETRRYVAFSQKFLVKVLNGEMEDSDVLDRWTTTVKAYTNPKTYQRFEAVL